MIQIPEHSSSTMAATIVANPRPKSESFNFRCVILSIPHRSCIPTLQQSSAMFIESDSSRIVIETQLCLLLQSIEQVYSPLIFFIEYLMSFPMIRSIWNLIRILWIRLGLSVFYSPLYLRLDFIIPYWWVSIRFITSVLQHVIQRVIVQGSVGCGRKRADGKAGLLVQEGNYAIWLYSGVQMMILLWILA